MAEIHQGYRKRAKFYMVYIREAHPSDGHQMQANLTEGIVYRQPRSGKEREKVASDCRKGLGVRMPILLDDMANSVDRAYAGWPVRLYVVDKEGRVAFKGAPGPRGFVPSELRRYMEKTFGPPEKAEKADAASGPPADAPIRP